MTFIDPTDIHMTGQQAEDFADAQCARLQPDHSAPDAWWIVAEKHAGKPAFAFRLREIDVSNWHIDVGLPASSILGPRWFVDVEKIGWRNLPKY
ncbi:MAG: hypothetical protein ACPGGK_19505 [Pikeienuella sp.]